VFREAYPTLEAKPKTDRVRNTTNTNKAPRGLAPEPTLAMPGSAEKILVMQQRVAAGYELWHPEDARG
jgi:hypothetical protein